MALEKRLEVGVVTVLADGQLQVREDTVYLDNGVEVARTFHRRVLEPSLTDTPADPLVRAVASVVWTAERVAAREQALLGITRAVSFEAAPSRVAPNKRKGRVAHTLASTPFVPPTVTE